VVSHKGSETKALPYFEGSSPEYWSMIARLNQLISKRDTIYR